MTPAESWAFIALVVTIGSLAAAGMARLVDAVLAWRRPSWPDLEARRRLVDALEELEP